MTDDNDSNRQAPASGGRAPLTLKPRIGGAVSSGVVKQSFSHGRSKTVVVETKRRRADAPPVAPSVAERRPAPIETKAPSAPPAAVEPSAPSAAGTLSEDERRARQRAIELAREQQQRAAAQREAATVVPAPTVAEIPVSARFRLPCWL